MQSHHRISKKIVFCVNISTEQSSPKTEMGKVQVLKCKSQNASADPAGWDIPGDTIQEMNLSHLWSNMEEGVGNKWPWLFLHPGSSLFLPARTDAKVGQWEGINYALLRTSRVLVPCQKNEGPLQDSADHWPHPQHTFLLVPLVFQHR